MTPNRNEPFSSLTNPVAGVRKPKTCGIASTKIIFVRKWTWPSGRVTAGSRSVSGFSAYSRLFFFSSRGIGLLPGVPWEDDLAASAGDLRDGRRRGLRDGDPHCHRYATRA